MRTALTILAVAVGKLLCRLGRHKYVYGVDITDGVITIAYYCRRCRTVTCVEKITMEVE